jgi:hypothetical protein
MDRAFGSRPLAEGSDLVVAMLDGAGAADANIGVYQLF